MKRSKQISNINIKRLSIFQKGILIILAIFLNSCDLNTLNLSCDDCYDVKPTEGLLMIDLAPVGYGDSIPVTIYRGKLESGTVYLRDTIVRSYLDIWVPVDYFYTVVAEYTLDSTIIKAVDGAMIEVYLDESNCSVSCWRAKQGKADCRLR